MWQLNEISLTASLLSIASLTWLLIPDSIRSTTTRLVESECLIRLVSRAKLPVVYAFVWRTVPMGFYYQFVSGVCISVYSKHEEKKSEHGMTTKVEHFVTCCGSEGR